MVKEKRNIFKKILIVMLLVGLAFPAVFVHAEEAKMLGTRSLKVGQTVECYLTDSSGKRIQGLSWTSTKPSVAKVTSSGYVTGVKAGTAVIKTRWNNTLYGIKVVVESASTKTLTHSQAFNKIAKYIKKTDTAKSSQLSGVYTVMFDENMKRVTSTYNITKTYYLLSLDDGTNKRINMSVMLKGKATDSLTMACYKATGKGNNKGVHISANMPSGGYGMYTPATTYSRLKKGTTLKWTDPWGEKVESKYSSHANSAYKKLFTMMSKYLKKKAGVTMTELGFGSN